MSESRVPGSSPVPLGAFDNALVRTPEPEDLASAARVGALASVLPAIALSVPIPFLWQEVFWWPIRALAQIMPGAPATFLWATVIFVLPALLAIPVSWVTRKVVASRGRRHPELGKAAAAGACLAATLATLTVIVGKNLVIFEPEWIGLQLMATALGIGVLGARTFGAVRGEKGQKEPVPALYAGLATAGLTGPLLFLGATLWGLAAHLVPALSPVALAKAVGLTGGLARSVGALAVGLVAMAPLTAMAGRASRRFFPAAPTPVLRAGVLLPTLVALSFVTAPLLTGAIPLTAKRFWILVMAWIAGLAAQGLATRVSLPSIPRERNQQLGAGSDPLELPAG